MMAVEDPRLTATRENALDAALVILKRDGVLSVTHGAVGEATGISRSTLYRHWKKLEDLRNAVFLHAASGANYSPRTEGPLREDMTWIMGRLATALTESDWGKIAPQLIAVAATDDQARQLLDGWMYDRGENVREVLDAAAARGELADDVDLEQIIDVAISVPYFRKLIAGKPLDQDWLGSHVDLICWTSTTPTKAGTSGSG